MMSVTIATAILLLVVIGAMLFAAWRKRRSARRWLEALADRHGFRRLPGETDAELRERCARVLRHPPGSSRTAIEDVVRDALWSHGYRRADVIAAALEPGRITVRVLSPRVPADVLQLVEEEVAEMIPCGMILEIQLSKRWAT